MEATALAGRTPRLAKYEILAEIGHGGMATVYRAVDRRLGREVAVKVIHPHLRDSREVVSRFNAEARAVAKLRHPNIVEVFDVSEADEPEQYLVAELVRGTTLRKVVQGRPMPPEIAAALALELLGALAHAHAAGVVHRDVKPENVLLEHRTAAASSGPEASAGASSTSVENDRVVVKLTDFGIAKLLDAQGVTSTGQVLGSPAHMAPEQIEGGEVDVRADVFGLGVLLYECMVGHLPFEGTNPAQVLRRVLEGRYPEAQMERPVIGSRWSAVVDRALAHAPGDRYPDANAMRDAILAELDRLEIAAPKRELTEWFDDADAYEDRHTARMIERLRVLGGDARKRGDTLSAAADYNRALAHAPHDPNLLRIVAGMNRAERRMRLLRRGGIVLLLMSSMAAIAFGVGRFLRSGGFVANPASSASAGDTPRHRATVLVPLVPAETSSPAATAAPHPIAPPILAQRPIERTLTLDLKPSMGITVSVDESPPRRVNSGDTVVVDGRAHALSFMCEVCTPVRREVSPGDRDDRLNVVVPIKPAALVIEGDVDKTYQIVQHPEVAVRAGTNSVSLGSAYERVTVQQVETKVSIPVRLEAGKSVHAAF